jgi:predicted nucleotidyltransferase
VETRRDLNADLDWLVERIREGYEPEKIILFGSLARGDTHEWSDIDLIVVKDTDASYGERVRELLPVLRGWRGGADIIVYSLEEYERARTCRGSFLKDAENDGVTLYERR